MNCTIALFDPTKNDFIKTQTISDNYRGAEERVKELNEKLSKKPNKKGNYWKVTGINT